MFTCMSIAMDDKERIQELTERNSKLEEELAATKEHLKKYTAPKRSKTYYENHKEDIIKRVKEYKQLTNYTYKVSPEKKKEYNRRAYLKRVDTLKNESDENQNI